MKKFFYLLAFTFMLVNSSCSSFQSFLNGSDGVCNCTCSACVNCVTKHGKHVSPSYQQTQITQQLNDEEARRKATLDSLLNLDFSIVHYDVPEDPTPADNVIKVNVPYYWDENEEIAAPLDSLSRLFKTTKTEDVTEYVHKGTKTDVSKNDIYFYFTVKDGVPEPMHLVVNYYADDPIEFESLKLNIDGYKYDYKPTNIKREKQGKFYIERFDNVLTDKSRDMAAALSKCRYVGGASNILLHSKKGVSHRVYLTKDQAKHFRDTYNLYRKMGGKL